MAKEQLSPHGKIKHSEATKGGKGSKTLTKAAKGTHDRHQLLRDSQQIALSFQSHSFNLINLAHIPGAPTSKPRHVRQHPLDEPAVTGQLRKHAPLAFVVAIHGRLLSAHPGLGLGEGRGA